ncbi:MAG TPA: tetratricopeptide repeat protein [Thermoanaerobaculia bacterium]|nr:tetratricopeptide repeat protein [Thermoanaerobaculia bacterium]
MSVKKYSLVFLAVLCASALSAQDWTGRGRLEGNVKDADGKPIANATVSLRWTDGKGPDVKTNDKGHWARMGLNGGQWNVDISAPGYQTKKTSFPVSQAARNEPINVTLEKAAPQEAPHEELSVGGKKISKETADAIEKANAAWNEKNWAEARANYEKVLVDLPDNQGVLEHLELACYNAKQYDDALNYAKKVVAVAPDDTNSWLIIAEIELQKGNLDEGKAAMEKVPDEKITDPGPYLNMGINYYNKGRAADADQWFTKAITKAPESPDNADAYYYRGLARYSEKHVDDAKADFEKYLQIAPTGTNADTVKELLNSMKPGKPARKTPSHG